MRFRRLTLLTATLAIVALGASPASALPTTFRAGPATVPLPSGSLITLSGPSDPATLLLTSGTTGDIRCTKTVLGLTVGVSHGVELTGTLRNLTFESCTDSLPFDAFPSCSLANNAPTPTVRIDPNASGGRIRSTFYVRCADTAVPGYGCYYLLSDVKGTYTNSNATLAYSNVSFSYQTPFFTSDSLGSDRCGNFGTLTASLTSVTWFHGTTTTSTKVAITAS
jgi:hypothetical protein